MELELRLSSLTSSKFGASGVCKASQWENFKLLDLTCFLYLRKFEPSCARLKKKRDCASRYTFLCKVPGLQATGGLSSVGLLLSKQLSPCRWYSN